jgi:transcriptional regulator with XRE-family HTH domain
VDVAARLRQIREKRGLSIYRLAQISNVSQSFLSALEAGQKVPTVTTLERICGSLGISLAEFFDTSPVPAPTHLQDLWDETRYLTAEQSQKLAEFLRSLRADM